MVLGEIMVVDLRHISNGIFIYTYVHIYIYTHIHIYIYTYIHIWIYMGLIYGYSLYNPTFDIWDICFIYEIYGIEIWN